jgi:RND family efflux transporter MFP subunit
MSDKPGRSLFWLKLIVVVAALAAIAYGVRQYVRPIAKVEAVISGDAVDAKPGSVTVKEKYSMQMKAAIAGRVIAKDYNLDPGMKIKAGDILVQLDTGDIDIEIQAAKNTYESSKAKVAVGSVSKYALESATSDFTHTERLFKMGQISDSDYQKARRAVETIKQQQMMEDVLNQENLDLDQTTLATKERAKDKMTISAPFDGEVSYVYAHPGDLIDTGSPIVALITLAREVQAKISEEDFADIKVGQKVSTTFLPYGDFVYNGVVEKILPTADPETLRHLIDLTITDIPPAKLIPGITGEVSIEVGKRHANAIIPRRALLNENVYVVKDGKVELRQVKKGYVWLTGVEILEGLEPGEDVIVEDLESFRAGDSVKIQELPSDAFSKKK